MQHGMESLKEKTTKGLFWGGISHGVQQLLSVLIGIVLLKNLTQDDYGMIGLLAIFTGIANTIQDSGFTIALTNRAEFKNEDYNSVFWFNLITGSSLYVILFFLAPLIAQFYEQPELILLSRILFLSIITSSLGIAHNAVLFKKMMVKERAKIDILSTLIAGCIGIFLALNGFGYWALAIQTLLFSSMGTFLRWYFSPWRPTFYFDFEPIKSMFGFSSKMLISSIVTQIQGNVFSVLLGKFDTISDVGNFSQGTKWASMGSQFINGMVNSVAQPTFVQLLGDKERMVQAFRKMLRFIAFISFPAMLGLAYISDEFIGLINERWLPCVPILQIYCIWGAVAPIHLLYTQVVVCHGDSNYFVKNNFFFAISQIAIAIIVLPLGLYWMAFSNIVIGFVFLFIWHFYVRKILPINLFQVIKDITPYLFITLFVFGLVELFLIVMSIESKIIILCIKILFSIILYLVIMKKSNSVIFREFLEYFYIA